MFSVVIPVHNKLPHLDRSVQSVLNQSFGDFELLLIDDASSDGSSEKIKEYTDPRIRTFRRDTPGPGGYAGRNLGIKEAKYDWIAFLDADDEWKEDFLLERKKLIEKDKDLQIISSKWVNHKAGENYGGKRFNFIQEKYHSYTFIDFLNFNGLIWTGAVSIKKELLLKAGLFPDGKCKRGGDLDTWIRCLYYGEENNVFINQTLSIYYRDTVNQVTDGKKNPSTGFCCAESLTKIKEERKEYRLNAAIDNFYKRHVSGILSRGKVTKTYKRYLLGLIDLKTIKFEVLFKVFLRKIGIIQLIKKIIFK